MTSSRLLAAAAALLIVPLAAGASDVLTLEQAIAIALEQNHLLGAAEAGLAAADARLEEARGSRLPSVVLSETASRTTNPVGVFGGLLGQERFGPENFDPVFLNNPDALDNFATMISVEQPIYAGGRIASGRRAAASAREAAAAARESARQRVIHGVLEAYSGAVLAQRQLEVAESARKTAEAHVRLVRDLYEGGLVVESDLLQAQVRESEVAEMLIRAEAGVAVSQSALNLALGSDAHVVHALPRDIDIDTSAPDPLDGLIETALASRPDLRAATSRADAAEQASRAARGGLLPEVGAAGNYQLNDDALLGTNGQNWTVAIVARWTVFDGGRVRSRAQGSASEARAAFHMRDLLRQQVVLDVRRAWHDTRAALERLSQSKRAVDLAEAGLRIVEDRYRNGLTTLVELLEAETSLTRARTREVSARRDLLLARASLNLATGRL